MSSFTSRLFRQQQLGYVPHTSVSGETWQHIQKGTATSNGAADGTTVIDTNSDSGGARTYNGPYWIRMVSGTAQGEWSRIVEDDGSGTYTLENLGFSAQIDSGDEFEIWLSPEPVLTVTTSTSTTQFTCSVRTEAADFWKDYYAVVIYGSDNGGTSAARGELQKISTSTALGVITVDTAFTNQPRVGDVLVLRKFVEISPPTLGLTEPYIPRPNQRVNFAKGDGVIGAKGGSFPFNTHIYPSGSFAASGSEANPSPLSGLFQGCGYTETVDTSSTAGAGSTTSAVTIATGSRENHSVGGAIIHNGNVAFINTMDDGGAGVDTLNIEPALPVAPAESDPIYAMRRYALDTSGDALGVFLEFEIDGYRVQCSGCKGNVALQAGEPLQLAWAFQVDHYVESLEAAPYNAAAAYTAQQAVLEHERIAWLDTTKTSIEGFTCSLNTTVAPKPIQGAAGVNGRSGYQVTDYAPGGTFRELLDSSSATLPQLGRWNQRTSKDLKISYGEHERTFAVRIPVAMLTERPAVTDIGGLAGVPNVFQAQDAGTALDATTVTKVPDLAFFIV
jgi:hypothetical protein